MNRKLKKYNLKYEYLKLEEEDTRDELSQYIEDFDRHFNKYYHMPKSGSHEVWVNEETGEVRDEPPPLDDIFENYKKAKEEQERSEKKRLERIEELKSRPDKLKKLYKKLAIKSHPDRGGSDELFQEVNDAYTENNLMWLLRKAGEYEIEYQVDNSDEKILSNNLNEIESEIDRMKGTLAWAWGTGDVNERKFVVSRVEKETGMKIDKDDLPPDLRPKSDEKKLLGKKKSLISKK